MRKNFPRQTLIILIVLIGIRVSGLTAQDQTNDSTKPAIGSPNSQTDSTSFPYDEGTEKIFRRNAIQDAARRFEKQELYDEAIAKYREAADPSLLNHNYEAGVAIGGIERIYQKQGKFELALKELQWHLERNPEKYRDKKLELEALIKARDTKSTQPIYEHIEYLKKKYKDQLPPKTCIGMCDTIFTTITCLYDHIGDYDAGIEFTEGFLKFYKKVGPGNPYQSGNQHFQVKQAFLQDKAEGRKSCVSAKPGEVCMGRATKALIQSNYFPW